jgi:hypothetical protein
VEFLISNKLPVLSVAEVIVAVNPFNNNVPLLIYAPIVKLSTKRTVDPLFIDMGKTFVHPLEVRVCGVPLPLKKWLMAAQVQFPLEKFP